MPHPTLHDDGHTVTLDLHGARVDEALSLARRAVAAAARHGRTAVKLIHGDSTSHPGRRTIKNSLHALLDDGALAAYVTSDWRADGHLLLSLDATATPDPTRLRLRDLRR